MSAQGEDSAPQGGVGPSPRVVAPRSAPTHGRVGSRLGDQAPSEQRHSGPDALDHGHLGRYDAIRKHAIQESPRSGQLPRGGSEREKMVARVAPKVTDTRKRIE